MYEDQIPSFMSVFDLDAETMADRDTVTVVDPRFVGADTKQPTLVAGTPQQMATGPGAAHRHANSNSTESADSSPTTTLSTTDSSPLSDPSPSSSPDSPVSLVPLNQYPATTFSGRRVINEESQAQQNPPPNALNNTGPFARPMTSPAPRRRNMKGLSIQPPSVSGAINSTVTSEPSSPSFIKPKIPAMKRKPSLLSLNTNASDLNTRSRGGAEVPPSPGMPPILQRRALKHSASTPHMLTTIQSATFGPAGGMTLPNMLQRNESGLSEALRPMKTSVKPTFDDAIDEEPDSAASIRPQMASRMDIEPYHEKVNNEDQKTPGYPDGPVAMYDDNVFLYLEPTSEEAAKFDVVINVAKEVKNPFNPVSRPTSQIQGSTPVQSPIPDTALTDASFSTAFEFPTSARPSGDETPTTPKASNPLNQPEYIHVPWDHNTDISPDLMGLCETIQDRTRRGKKVLVHCQQGASRSASLIIAYGMYCRPESSVNDAYYAAQSKSQWISPNMKLMYSLQDFQKELSQKRLPGGPARSGRSPTKHRLTLSASAVGLPPKEPRTAPLPGDDGRPPSEHGDTEEKSVGGLRPALEVHRRGNSMPGPGGVSPGPATAPPKYSWQEEVERSPEYVAARAEPASALEPTQPLFSELPERPKQTQTPPPALSLPKQTPPSLSFSTQTPSSLNLPPTTETTPSLPTQSVLTSVEPPPTPGFAAPAGFTFHQNKTFPRFSNSARLSRIASVLPGDDEPADQRSSFLSNLPPAPTRASPPPPVPTRASPPPPVRTLPPSAFSDDIMSPRAETMTSNPLHDQLEAESSKVPGLHFAEAAPPTPGHDMFSPRATMFPRDPCVPFGRPTQVADPRSPPTKGETPIVRSIDDIL